MKNNFSNIFLVCLFLLGNGIITFFSGSIFALLLFIALCGAAVFVLSKPLCLNGFSVEVFKCAQKNAVFKALLFALLFALCLFAFCDTSKDYFYVLANGAKNAFHKTALRFAFCGLTLCLALCKKSVIKMFAKASFFIVVLAFVIMLLSTARSFNFSFLKDAFYVGEIAKPTVLSVIKSFGELFICFLFIGGQNKKNAKTISVYALSLGACFYLICFFNSLFVIGGKVSTMVFSPYAFSTASVFSGEEFARVDLLVYYVFFVCATVKEAVILWTVLSSANAIHTLLKKITAVIFLIVGTFNFSFLQDTSILLALEIITPVLFFVFVKKLNSHQPARHS